MKPTHSIFDTETSGLFNFALPADDPSQPRLATFAMIYVDADAQELRRTYKLIKPDGWVLSAEAASVNKLTMERLHDEGVPLAEVLDEYTEAVRAGTIMAAFNAQFDCKMMRGELRRAGRDDLFALTNNICLMRACTDVCKIPPNGNRGGYKFPKLSEACVFFGIQQPDAHNSLADAESALAIFRRLKDMDALPEAKVHLAKPKDDTAPKAAKRKPRGPASALDEIPA